VDIHAFGNASGPQAPRAGVDFEVGPDGMVVPQSGPLPVGASTFADPSQSGLAGIHHSIPAGTEMPPGFGIVADGVDVVPGSPHAATHHTIFPTQPMRLEQFCAGSSVYCGRASSQDQVNDLKRSWARLIEAERSYAEALAQFGPHNLSEVVGPAPGSLAERRTALKVLRDCEPSLSGEVFPQLSCSVAGVPLSS